MKRQQSKTALVLACASMVLVPSWVMSNDATTAGHQEVQKSATHMPEGVRSAISKIVILATEGGSNEAVTGTYGKKTDGVLGGMAEGSKIGQIPIEVGGVPIGIPIPILREIGMLVGAVTGGYKRELQEFRDRLTQDLKSAVDQPLSNDALANDVFWGLRNVSSIEPKILALTTPIPEETDAILYVALTDLSINVQGRTAIISTTATARVEKASDGTTLYRREITYQDQDTLKNWVDDDTARWREYRNFARHFLGREISAELFERVELNHTLAPAASDDIRAVRNKDWQTEARSRNPTLVWDLELLGGDVYGDWAGKIDESTITWDVEVYDAQRPVYTAKQVRGTRHAVATTLETCEVYHWSVRPSYHVDGVRKNGNWMRVTATGAEGNGNVGRDASVAHAYIQDFPSFKVKCRLK